MPNDNLSLFVKIYQFFSANTGYDINRSTLKPTTIDQYEIGVKKEFMEQCNSS